MWLGILNRRNARLVEYEPGLVFGCYVMEWRARGGGGGLLGSMARRTASTAECHALHLPDDGGSMVRLLPPGLGKVLPQLLRHGAVDVLVPRRVAGDPGVPKG